MNRKLLRTGGLSAIAGVALVLTLGLGSNPAAAIPAADLWYTTTGAGGWIEVSAANTVVGNCPQSAAAFPSCGTGNLTFNAAGFTINVNTITNAPGSPAGSLTSNASILVSDHHTDGALHDIWFVAGGTGFISPLGDTLFSTNTGNSILATAGGSVSAFACVRLDNTVDNTHSCDSVGSPPDFITPTATGPIPGGITVPWALPTTTTSPIALSAPYALIDEVRLTLKNGSVVNFSSSAVVLPTAVPEPASLAIFGSALLGFGLIRRRRNG